MKLKLSQTGIFTIEAIAALCISVPCLLSIAAFIAFNCKNYLRLAHDKEHIFNAIKFHEILEEINQDIDRHPFAIYPRIHQLGKINFSDGSSNHISSSKDKQPLLTADAVTYARLDTLAMQEILQRSGNTSIAKFRACSRYGNFFNKEKYKSYWVVTPNGIFETIGSVKTSGSIFALPCYEFELSNTKSMLLDNAAYSDIQFAQYIIPVESTYTYYLDVSKRLRFVGHRGTDNIENQPALENIETLTLQNSLIQNADILHLSAAIASKASIKPIYLSSNNHIARLSSLNFILNTQ